MQAARGDAAEVRANIAAVGQTRAIPEQQATNHCRQQRARRDFQAGSKTPGQAGGQQRTENDANIHYAGDVFPHRRGQCLGIARHLPEPPTANINPQSACRLGAPQRERRSNTPRPPGQCQRGIVQQRQTYRPPDQRPRPTQKAAQALMFTGHPCFKAGVTGFLQAYGHCGDDREHGQAQQQGGNHPEAFNDRGRRKRRQGKPPVNMLSGD